MFTISSVMQYFKNIFNIPVPNYLNSKNQSYSQEYFLYFYNFLFERQAALDMTAPISQNGKKAIIFHILSLQEEHFLCVAFFFWMCMPQLRIGWWHKGQMYEELEQVFDQLRRYHTKILLGDFTVKVEREDIFELIIGKESLHEVSDDNRIIVVNFTNSKNLTFRSTTFSHHDIHNHLLMESHIIR